MNNSNLVSWVLLAGCLLAAFLSGWAIKDSESSNRDFAHTGGPIIRIHDTLKVPLVEYRIIPGMEYNVDSIIEQVNQFWKDSLKEIYGKGLFEAKFVKEDNTGKREIEVESRIPIDPEAKVTIDEAIKLPEVYPKRTFGINAGLCYEMKNKITGLIGLKYYLLDYRYFSFTGILEGRYSVNNLGWNPAVRVETEVRF